jgi:hypothetical protein
MLGGIAIVAATASAVDAEPPIRSREVPLAPREFRVLERESGPVNYYSVVGDDADAFVHAAYRPPWETAVLAHPVPDELRRSVATVRWRWRALVLPAGGDECASGKGDSAAVVYVTWKRGLRWYALKYVWSAVGRKGAVCDGKRNPFRAQDTVIVESGGPLGAWRTVTIDPDAEFRRHFAPDDPRAEVPDLAGVAIMSDGDATRSASEADYGGFVLTTR